jgi:hypothetical protein
MSQAVSPAFTARPAVLNASDDPEAVVKRESSHSATEVNAVKMAPKATTITQPTTWGRIVCGRRRMVRKVVDSRELVMEPRILPQITWRWRRRL